MVHSTGPRAVATLAGMLAAMGTEPRLRIMRALLASHPRGLVVSEIQDALGIPGPTLSHHLEKLRRVDLVRSRREGTYLRYSVRTDSLKRLLGFLYSECCGRNKLVSVDELIRNCRC
jgi:ArsR family transcriptional regulator, arsenate/arsenite/antimonite-responsive transcriptional repressor